MCGFDKGLGLRYKDDFFTDEIFCNHCFFGVGLRSWNDSSNCDSLYSKRVLAQLWSCSSAKHSREFTMANICSTGNRYCLPCLASDMTGHMTLRFSDVGEPRTGSCTYVYHDGIVLGLGDGRPDFLCTGHPATLYNYEGWKLYQNIEPLVDTRTGYRDCVQCFYCGVDLRTLEEEENPWVEHVQFIKGIQFVADEQQGHFPTEVSSQVNDEIHSVTETTLHKDNNNEYMYNIQKLYSPLYGAVPMPCQKQGKGYDYMDKNYYLSSIQPTQFLVVNPFTSLRNYFQGIATGSALGPKEHYEGFRLQSYSNVHVDSSPVRLAAAGFYATGNEDETKCYSCGGTKRDWQTGDNPFEVHQAISPDCIHIRGRDPRNVPIHSTATRISQEEQSMELSTNEGTNLQVSLQMASSFDHHQDYSLGDDRIRTSTNHERGVAQINSVDGNTSSQSLALNEVVNEEQRRENRDEMREFEDVPLEVTLGYARLSQVSEEGNIIM